MRFSANPHLEPPFCRTAGRLDRSVTRFERAELAQAPRDNVRVDVPTIGGLYLHKAGIHMNAMIRKVGHVKSSDADDLTRGVRSGGHILKVSIR
jgi:hypothetical protein